MEDSLSESIPPLPGLCLGSFFIGGGMPSLELRPQSMELALYAVIIICYVFAFSIRYRGMENTLSSWKSVESGV